MTNMKASMCALQECDHPYIDSECRWDVSNVHYYASASRGTSCIAVCLHEEDGETYHWAHSSVPPVRVHQCAQWQAFLLGLVQALRWGNSEVNIYSYENGGLLLDQVRSQHVALGLVGHVSSLTMLVSVGPAPDAQRSMP